MRTACKKAVVIVIVGATAIPIARPFVPSNTITLDAHTTALADVPAGLTIEPPY